MILEGTNEQVAICGAVVESPTAPQIAYDGGETHQSAPGGGDRIAVRFGEQGKWWNGISDAHRAAIRRDPSYGIEEAFNAGWKAALAAAPSVAIGAGEVEREGWKLVPVEPTEAMYRAAEDAEPSDINDSDMAWFEAGYAAILAASPNPPAAPSVAIGAGEVHVTPPRPLAEA